MDRISPYLTLGSWVSTNVLNGHRPSDEEMRLFRIRWLDHLICEFSQ